MAIIPGGDVRQLLGRLRGSAQWGWKGGAIDDTEQVVWRDPIDVEPTERQYLDEQILLEAEIATADTTRTAQKLRSDPTNGKLFTALTTAEKDALLEDLLTRAGAFNGNGTIRDVESWIPPTGESA